MFECYRKNCTNQKDFGLSTFKGVSFGHYRKREPVNNVLDNGIFFEQRIFYYSLKIQLAIIHQYAALYFLSLTTHHLFHSSIL